MSHLVQALTRALASCRAAVDVLGLRRTQKIRSVDVTEARYGRCYRSVIPGLVRSCAVSRMLALTGRPHFVDVVRALGPRTLSRGCR